MADRPDVEAADNRSIKEIIEGILHEIQNIIQAEIRLARTEIAQKTGPLKSASLFLGIAAVCGILGAGCLVVTCIAALALVMPVWLAALLIGIGLCGIAGGAFTLGRTRIEQVDPAPRRTVETLKDDWQWAKRHIS